MKQCFIKKYKFINLIKEMNRFIQLYHCYSVVCGGGVFLRKTKERYCNSVFFKKISLIYRFFIIKFNSDCFCIMFYR